MRLHATIAVGVVVYGQSFGWLPRTCPPIDGYHCAADSVAFSTSKYVSFVALAWVAMYLTGYVGTSLQAQEAEARQVAQAWEQVTGMRSRFVSQASHEFRTPLAVIASTTAVLRRYGDRLDPEARDAKLEATVRRMTELLERVLLLGRSESDAVDIRWESTDVAHLVEDIANDARAMHTVRFTADGTVPAITTDPMLLRQVLTNLLSNAIKVSPHGGWVEMRVCAVADGVQISIRDEGLGMPRDQQEHVFDAFQRASNAGVLPGTGLGLAIARRAVELLQGRLELPSDVGQGMVVTITLPPTGAASADVAA